MKAVTSTAASQRSARKQLQKARRRTQLLQKASPVSKKVIVKERVEAAVSVAPEPVVAEARGPYDGNTALTLYMREVGKVNLLTPKEEIELAAKIKKGNAKARDLMIRANLRLVVKIAREYDGLGLPLLDLINEGNMGLMLAVERFDPKKGAKLSTYSSWWIKQSIRRALANQSKTIRLPVHMVDKIYNMKKVSLKLQELLGREPTDEEVAAEMGLSRRQVADMRGYSIRPASLDAPIGDDDSTHLSDVVQDENASSPYDNLEEKTVTHMLKELVDRLNPREASILRYRFGLEGGSERTLEEVGAKFGVTRERIRQLQNLALLKLRKMIETLEAMSAAE
ncbi:MAG: polymerase, sigma 70 subunit, RpoD subfamily [Pedosphaera sp.]|nr:polymerase, sigma 70 subunit, RpoD subfamily [Pedosphaera sp.]